jgi:hypothetical protein
MAHDQVRVGWLSIPCGKGRTLEKTPPRRRIYFPNSIAIAIDIIVSQHF